MLDADVEFILVGGVAGIVHGAARATFDIDVVYRRSADNIARLVEALRPIQPYLRGAPPGLPFVFDAGTVQRGLNFTLETAVGDLDLLGEITGGGSYDQLVAGSVIIDVFGHSCRTVSLETLVRLKRAAGRPKDLEAIAELEALLDERDRERG
jgi:hypothetical protein